MYTTKYRDNEYIENIGLPEIIKYNDRFLKLALGEKHVIGINLKREVLGWGDNSDYQLSEDLYNTIGDNIDIPQKINNILNGAFDIACGKSSSFAITKGSSYYAWGNNNNGQFGNSIKEDLNTNIYNIKINFMDYIQNIDSIIMADDFYLMTTDNNTRMFGVGNSDDHRFFTNISNIGDVYSSLPYPITEISYNDNQEEITNNILYYLNNCRFYLNSNKSYIIDNDKTIIVRHDNTTRKLSLNNFTPPLYNSEKNKNIYSNDINIGEYVYYGQHEKINQAIFKPPVDNEYIYFEISDYSNNDLSGIPIGIGSKLDSPNTPFVIFDFNIVTNKYNSTTNNLFYYHSGISLGLDLSLDDLSYENVINKPMSLYYGGFHTEFWNTYYYKHNNDSKILYQDIDHNLDDNIIIDMFYESNDISRYFKTITN